jgi:serine/threonine-protein kinase 24/25/MST4
MRSDWNFDTVKSMSALGTYSGTVNDLLYSAMVSEDNEPLDDGEVNGSINSEVETNGSDPIIGIGMNLDTAYSTVIITTPRSPGPVNTTDETPSGAALYLTSCHTLLS